MCESSLVDQPFPRYLYIDFGGSRPSGATQEVSGSAAIASSNPDHVGGYQVLIHLSDFKKKSELIPTNFNPSRWRHPSSQECSPNLVSFSPSSATNSGDQHTCVCASVNLTMLSIWLGLVVNNNNNNNHLCCLSQVEKPLTWVSVIYTYM